MKQLRLEDFDAIAFDVEGTLADTIPTHHQTRMQAFQEHGYGHITAEQHALGVTYGSVSAAIIGGILHAAGHIQADKPYTDHPVVQDIIASNMALFTQLAEKGFMEIPGASAFVIDIADQFHGPLGLVTSSHERFVMPFLDKYQLSGYFPHDRIISQDTVEQQGIGSKPSADPYLLAMKRLAAPKLLVFEDTVPGTESAKRAGATVIAIANDPVSRQKLLSDDLEYKPDAVVNTYNEARILLGVKTN